MAIVEGSVAMTIGGRDAGRSRPATSCVVNRGLEHELYSERRRARSSRRSRPCRSTTSPDPERDLVLGPDGGAGHVER